MVLLVDDQPGNCAPIRVAMGRRGVPVVCVGSGDEALAFVEHDTPSVIVMDEMMPGLTGRDTVRRLRARPELAETPVIFYTASLIEPSDVEGLRVVGFFRKGCSDVRPILDCIEAAYRDSVGPSA